MRESKFKIEFMSEEQKEAFIVLSKEYMENLELKTNSKDTPCMFALENYYIKEDKMEEIRVVRKLEDLDRLENGKGLKVYWCEADKCLEIYFNSRFIDRVFSIDRTDVLKAMGFKFEYKPLRNLEEVVEEARTKIVEFVHGKYNYLLVKTLEGYGVDRDVYLERVGSLYLCKEQAQKYADELNEILKNK